VSKQLIVIGDEALDRAVAMCVVDGASVVRAAIAHNASLAAINGRTWTAWPHSGPGDEQHLDKVFDLMLSDNYFDEVEPYLFHTVGLFRPDDEGDVKG